MKVCPSIHHGSAAFALVSVLFAAALLLVCGRDVSAQGAGRDLTTASDETAVRKRANIRMELAMAYYSRGQMITALDELKQALVIDPSLPGAYNLRGLIYDALSKDDLAEESYRSALSQDAEDSAAAHNYGWFLCRRRQYERADAMFEQALVRPRNRDASQILLVRGVCQSRAGYWDEAEKSLARSYEVGPGNPATASNLAYVLYRRGEYERARFYIRRVNKSAEQSNAETLWLATRIEHRLGNQAGVEELGTELRNRFPASREAAAFELGKFGD